MSLVTYSLEAELDIWLSQDTISTMNGLELTCDIVSAMPEGMITPGLYVFHTAAVVLLSFLCAGIHPSWGKLCLLLMLSTHGLFEGSISVVYDTRSSNKRSFDPDTDY